MTRITLAPLFVLVLVLGAGAPSAIAQTPAALPEGVALEVSVEREGDTIGDPVRLTVVVTHPADGELLVPPPEGPLGELEPAAPTVTRTTPTDVVVEMTLVYETRAFLTGLLSLEPPALSYRADGSIVPIQPPAQLVAVRSLFPADGSLVVRPLKPAEEIPLPGFPIVPVAIVIGVPAALLLAVGLTLRRRRVRAPGEAAPIHAPPDPGLNAACDLERIGAAGLLPQAVDEFCARVNTAVRRYLAERYRLPARNLTARELGDRLARAGADAGTVQRVRNLCQACDDIAYAGAMPNPDRVARYLDLAQAIVQPQGVSSDGAAPQRWAPPAQGDA